MRGPNQELIKRLRARIREFEDRKASGADLGREVYYVAREIAADEEGSLRRALELLGNRIMVLSEQSLASPTHGKILEVVDDLQGELIDHGY